MFEKVFIEIDNSFGQLSNIEFEETGKGRRCAIVVDKQNNQSPIVRTTTCYSKPIQKFQPIHYEIMKKIQDHHKITFNNAMIEVYNSSYRRMGFHTDQALDLSENSYICLFSCYKNKPSSNDIRKLIVRDKITKKECEFTLEHNSVILFSTKTNRKYLHKIILENMSDNEWLGATFRCSKTFIKYIDGVPFIYPRNYRLHFANDEERKEFFILKRMENEQDDFIYPEINYTISLNDIIE